MTTKETTVITLKLLLIYILIMIIIDAPTTAMYIVQIVFKLTIVTATKMESYWFAFWMIVVSTIVVWINIYILSWLLKELIYPIFSKDTQTPLVAIAPVKFELTILTILGLYFFVHGLSVIIPDIWYYKRESKSSFFYGMGIEGFMNILSYIIEIMVGLILMLFPKKVALFLINMRRDY